MTRRELYTRVLGLIGEREDQDRQRIHHDLPLWVSQAIAEALAVGSWSFARVRALLAPAEGGGFVLPDDCLRIIRCSADRYEVVGRVLFPSERARVDLDEAGRLPCLYVSSAMAYADELPDVDPNFLPDAAPLFCYGVELLLASKIAMVTTGRANMAASFAQLADAALRRALHYDVLQSASNDQRPALGREREGLPWVR